MPTWVTIGTSTLTPVEMTKRKEIFVPLQRTDYTLLYHYGDLDKTPMRGVSYLATLSNGEQHSGMLDDAGRAQLCSVPTGPVTIAYQHDLPDADDEHIVAAREKIHKVLDAIVAQTRTDMAEEWKRWNEAGWLKREYLERLRVAQGGAVGAWHWLSGTVESVWQLAVLCYKLDKEELQLSYLFTTGQWNALDQKIAAYRKKGRKVLKEASELKALLNLVFHDQKTRNLITAFARDWWAAIPPHEQNELVANGGMQIIVDVVIGVLLATFSAGAGGAAYGSAKWAAAGGRLGARLKELLDALKDAFEMLAKALRLRKRKTDEFKREANAVRVIETKWKPKAPVADGVRTPAVGRVYQGGAVGANSGPQMIVGRDAVNLSEFKRLNIIDSDVGRLRPGEAGAAAELQKYLKGNLERAAPGTPGDFVFTSGANAGKTVDFMLTPDNVAQAGKINNFFGKNASGFSDQLGLHLNKADFVPMDTRFLTNSNQSLLMDIINNQPAHLQSKIILFR